MSTTPHLALPLLAAAQAQKHVTHNEAIAFLDALVHLSVKERNRTSAPVAPEEGDRYLIGAGADGIFEGHDGDIALFDLGVWRFFPPRPGWRAFVEAEDALVVFDGAAWNGIGHYVHAIEQLDRLGIGTAADDLNRFAARLNAALFDAQRIAQGGTDDLRLVLNKPLSSGVLSLLYQSAYGGRAEAGLIGRDDFSLRVSSDGVLWRDAMVVDSLSGVVTFPCGTTPVGDNLLMNSGFAINQRAFAGGSLGSGAYGFDRWRGGPGGCSLSRGADGTVSFAGTLEQVVDVSLAESLLEAGDFGGCTLTLSVDDLTLPILATIGAKETMLPAGPGRSSATVTLDASETGHVRLQLSSGNGVTFRRIKLEIGPNSTPWLREPDEIEEVRCRRYYQRLVPVGTAPGVLPVLGQRRSVNLIDFPLMLPIPMRAAPTLLTNAFSWSGASPSGHQFGFLDNVAGAWINQTGGVVASLAGLPTPSSIILRFQAGAAFSGTAGNVGNLYLGSSGYIGLQAEI